MNFASGLGPDPATAPSGSSASLGPFPSSAPSAPSPASAAVAASSPSSTSPPRSAPFSRSLSSLPASGTDAALAALHRTTLGAEPPLFAAPYGSRREYDDEDEEEDEAEHRGGRQRMTSRNRKRTNEDGEEDGEEDDEEGEGEQRQLCPPGTATMPADDERSSDWRSLYVASFLAFCTTVQFSLYFSSMWPYLEVLDNNATERFFGYIVASYSLGQIIGSPVVGYLSNRMHKIRHLLYVGLLLMFFGNWLYLSVHLFPKNERKYLLCVARFITGIGSSNISLLKAYASTASTQRDRSRAIAFVTGGVALGSTMGPGFQLLFTPFGYPGFRMFGLRKFTLSMYTAPAMMACGMNVINALCIKTMFSERYVGVHNNSGQKTNGNNGRRQLLPYDRKAVTLCYVSRFTQMFVNTNVETLGAPLAMMMFAWTRAQAVKYISIAQVIMSLLAFLTYVMFIMFRVDKILSDRTTMLVSLVVLIMFHVLTYSYPFLPGRVPTFHHRDIRNHSIPEPVGCDVDKFNWCDSVRPLPPLYFYICYVLAIGLAFPNINVALNTLFSKIIGPRRQGTQQGVLQMSGGIARMVGPVVISSLYTSYGPQSAWLLELAVVSATLSLWFVLYKRMVPLEEAPMPGAMTEEEAGEGAEGEHAPGATESGDRRSKQRPLREERKPLVGEGPIREDDDEEEPDEKPNPNDVTVSTMASLA